MPSSVRFLPDLFFSSRYFYIECAVCKLSRRNSGDYSLLSAGNGERCDLYIHWSLLWKPEVYRHNVLRTVAATGVDDPSTQYRAGSCLKNAHFCARLSCMSVLVQNHYLQGALGSLRRK